MPVFLGPGGFSFPILVHLNTIIPVTNIKTKCGNSVSWYFKPQVFSVDLVVAKALCHTKVKSGSTSSWDYYDEGY